MLSVIKLVSVFKNQGILSEVQQVASIPGQFCPSHNISVKTSLGQPLFGQLIHSNSHHPHMKGSSLEQLLYIQGQVIVTPSTKYPSILLLKLSSLG